MPPIRVLVAHEPRAYREAMAAALAVLRPEADVVAVEPAELCRMVALVRPDLVFCGAPTAAVREAVPAWVEVSADGGRVVEMSIGGEVSTVPDLGLEDALALVDRAAALAAARAASRIGDHRDATGDG